MFRRVAVENLLEYKHDAQASGYMRPTCLRCVLVSSYPPQSLHLENLQQSAPGGAVRAKIQHYESEFDR
jgi:hypothetical protein